MALCRISGLCVVIAATLGVTPHQAWCDPIRITDGNVVADQEEPFTAVRISGDGLQFVSTETPHVRLPCIFTLCSPGQFIDLSSTWTAIDTDGSVVGGVTVSRAEAVVSFHAALAFLPSLPGGASAPFTATGVVAGLAPNGTVLTRVDVFVAGTLTFFADDLPPPSGFVSGYFYDASFEAPVPEPSTVILLMVGLGATAVRRHFA